MALGPWSINPAWQNFSSLCREASAAVDAPTDMEKSHHLTASLYFGIAALEAFLNQQMRQHLAPSKTSEEIFQALRTGRFLKKLKAWPTEIAGRESKVRPEVIELIEFCNDIRGDLTHPKTVGHDIYERLFEVNPLGPIKPRLNRLRRMLAITTLGSPWWVDLLVLWQPVKRVLRIALLGACAPDCRFEMLSLYHAESFASAKVERFRSRIHATLSRWS